MTFPGALRGCALLAVLCGLVSASAQAADTLRYVETADPHTLNPLLSSVTTEDDINALTHDLLVVTDEHGNLIPQLAQRVPTVANGDISADGKTITFRLRRGVRWQDGAPFTSADVRFTWQAIMNPKNNVTSRTGYDRIERIDTPDPYTAIFRLKTPYAPALASFFSGGQTPRILPEHLLAKYPDLNRVDYNAKPIGTGPFKVVSWNRGQSIELEANDGYFLGKPKLRHITIRIVPSTTTAGVMTKTGEADFAQLDSSTYRQLRDDPAVNVALGPQYAIVTLTLNAAREPLNDVRVRRAISMAIDRQGLIDKTTFGTGIAANSNYATVSWAHTDFPVPFGFDLTKAKALLDEAGWRPGADGIRIKNGRRLSLVMAEASGGTTGHGQDVLYQAMLKAAGIEVEIKAYSPTLLFQAQGIIPLGNFDLFNGGFVSSADPDDSTLLGCKYFPPNGQNYSRYCNNTIDELEQRALTTYDRGARKALYEQIAKIVDTEVPVVYMYYPKARFATNKALKGFAPNGVTPTWNAYQWSL